MKPPLDTFFRSESIALCQLFIQPEAAYASVSELGESGTVQFRDLNPDVNTFNRKFVNEVRRCDEMDRKLRYIESELRKDGVLMPAQPHADALLPRAPNPREIINLEARFEKTENEIMELSQNAIRLKSNYLELTELRCVLEKTQGFFAEQEAGRNQQRVVLYQRSDYRQQPATTTIDDAVVQQQSCSDANGRLGFVAGVIQRERVAGFERMLWRISRGNVFLRQAELDTPLNDPVTGDRLYKTVFVAFFQGEQLKSRIRKVCTGYHASIYPCPSAYDEREEMLAGVRVRLVDLTLVLNQTQTHRQRVLRCVAREWTGWSVMVRKMKAIYHTLNMFNMDVSKKCLIGECWVPVRDLPAVQRALADGSESVGSTIQSFLNQIAYAEAPPTFNRVNKFTGGFQALIDAYGVATYGEANPALYTIVTFPFLFATMFGDLGHGVLMTLFAAWMVLRERQLQAHRIRNEIGRIFFGGRYIILLMGLFSCYTGFVYNDVFAKSINVFGSAWHFDIGDFRNETEIALSPANGRHFHGDSTYPIGVDPVWQLATNKIIFLNSYKMKMSIIFGVAHMLFGVCMSVVNMRYARRWHAIVLEFVPQVLFLVLLFGYLAFLMFFKWVSFGARMPDEAHGPHCAPSILITFINMMLMKPGQANGVNCAADMYAYQPAVQFVLLMVALVCVPWMLLGKPLYVWWQRSVMAAKRQQEQRSGNSVEEVEGGETNMGMDMTGTEMAASEVAGTRSVPPAVAAGMDEHHDGEEEERISEMFILQAIHTIEYVLSTISHTASYLRLWALSLAHAQLSDVLWTMVLRKGIVLQPGVVGAILLYVIFAVWAVLTVAILVLMEGLSAFLHTLRLHWVEFMSKFYAGAGYAFVPFSFRDIIDAEEEF